MENSRTKKTVKNFTTGAIVQLANKLLAFITRTIFIKVLSEEYLGVNGLFSNVLTILSFAELGFGTTIIYNMYKPAAENNKERLKTLMDLYKNVYRVVGIVIAILGIIIIPFLGYIIKEPPNIKENITFIYLLFLTNTVVSYFFTYKKSIITAYQQESIINKYTTIIYVFQTIIQVIFLLLTKNYIVYLIIQIACTVLCNLITSIKADKMFPYLKEKNIIKISKEEKTGIFENVKAMILYKFGQTILNGTDSILVSAMFGISVVGLYSNYTLIITAVVGVLESALNSITGNIGNLNASANSNRKEDIFYQVFYVSFVLYGFCSIAIMILINPFIELWIGKEFLLDYIVVIALGISMFTNGIRFAGYTYRNTLGLFKKGKLAPLASAIINLVLSIVLGKLIGLSGIFFATAISRLVTTTWIDPYLIHKYEFHTPLKKFFIKYIKYFAIFIIEFLVSYLLTNVINIDNKILDFIISIFIVITVPNIMLLASTCFSKEFKALTERIKCLIIKDKINN